MICCWSIADLYSYIKFFLWCFSCFLSCVFQYEWRTQWLNLSSTGTAALGSLDYWYSHRHPPPPLQMPGASYPSTGRQKSTVSHSPSKPNSAHKVNAAHEHQQAPTWQTRGRCMNEGIRIWCFPFFPTKLFYDARYNNFVKLIQHSKKPNLTL